MSDNFNSTGIIVVAPDVPDQTQAAVSVRLMPGGTSGNSNTYIDFSGVTPRTLSLTLFFPTEALYLAFLPQVGQYGLLTYQEFPSGMNALLTGVTRTKRNVGTNNETWCTAQFQLTY